MAVSTRALARKMTRLTAGKTGFALGLALEGNERTSDLVGKRVGILAKSDHLLKRLVVHAAFKKGAAVGIGVFIRELLDEGVGRVREARSTLNRFKEAGDKRMIGFVSALLDPRERLGRGGRARNRFPSFQGCLRSDSKNRKGNGALLFYSVERLRA